MGKGAPGALERPSYTQLEKTLNGPDVSATSQSKMLLFTCAEILKVQYTASRETPGNAVSMKGCTWSAAMLR